MISLGKKIATDLQGGDVVLLYGDLGAGKTTLTKGMALGLGIESNIVSPTFTLMQVYQVQSPRLSGGQAKVLKVHKVTKLVHIDTYRLEDEKQLLEIGAQDYIGDPETVCVIEWAEKVEQILTNIKVKKIKIEHLETDGRSVEIKDER